MYGHRFSNTDEERGSTDTIALSLEKAAGDVKLDLQWELTDTGAGAN